MRKLKIEILTNNEQVDNEYIAKRKDLDLMSLLSTGNLRSGWSNYENDTNSEKVEVKKKLFLVFPYYELRPKKKVDREDEKNELKFLQWCRFRGEL